MTIVVTLLGVLWLIIGAVQLIIGFTYPPALAYATLDFTVGFSLAAIAIALIKGWK